MSLLREFLTFLLRVADRLLGIALLILVVHGVMTARAPWWAWTSIGLSVWTLIAIARLPKRR